MNSLEQFGTLGVHVLCKAHILNDDEEAIAMESDLDPQREMVRAKQKITEPQRR